MKVGKYVISVGIALTLCTNCYAITGESLQSIDSVGGKLEVISSDNCFDCSTQNLVLDKKIRILGDDLVFIQKKFSISPEKDIFLVSKNCSGSACTDGINTVLQVSKNKNLKSLVIDEFKESDPSNYSITKQGNGLVIEERNGWKITLNPDLQIIKKEISFTPDDSRDNSGEYKSIKELGGKPANLLVELPIVKKDLQAIGLYNYIKGRLKGNLELEKHYVGSITYSRDNARWEPVQSQVAFVNDENAYYILLDGFNGFIICSNLNESDIKKLTKYYLSTAKFEWGVTKFSNCYINSDTRSIPCKNILKK